MKPKEFNMRCKIFLNPIQFKDIKHHAYSFSINYLIIDIYSSFLEYFLVHNDIT